MLILNVFHLLPGSFQEGSGIPNPGHRTDHAKLRGTDANTIRDTVLSEFGFDEDRKIRFDLGGNAVIVTIGQDLSLRLTDEATGKEVKSVPKKNADPELHNLMVLEFKKGKPNKEQMAIDIEKLCYYTSHDNEYKYSFGFAI